MRILLLILTACVLGFITLVMFNDDAADRLVKAFGKDTGEVVTLHKWIDEQGLWQLTAQAPTDGTPSEAVEYRKQPLSRAPAINTD